MSWQPTHDTPTIDRPCVDGPPPDGPSRPDDRSRTARPLAAWLAIVGAALVLLAAIVVVAGQWQALSAEVRCVLLLAGVAVVFVVAEHLRPATPVTATVIGHLAPLMVAPAAVAAAATLHQSWRVCILVAGVTTVPFCEVQRRRWPLPLLAGGTVAAMALAAAGTAALVHVPVAVLGATAALLLSATAARRHALALAALSAAAPTLAVLADAKVGSGTLVEVGAAGPVLAWAAPAAGAMAAVVMGFEARRIASRHWAGGCVAAALVGALTGLSGPATPAPLWWLLPAVLLVLLEALDSASADGPWRWMAAPLRVVRVAVASLALSCGAVLLATPRIVADRVWVLPVGCTAAALALTAARTARNEPRVGDPFALAAVVTSVGVCRVVGLPLAWSAVLLCAVAVSVWVRRLPAPITAGGSAALSMLVFSVGGGEYTWTSAWLIAGIVVAGMAMVGTLPTGALQDPGAIGLALALPVLAAEYALADRLGGVLAIVAVGSVVVARMPRWTTMVVVGTAAVSLFGVATPNTSAVCLALGAAATAVWCRRQPLRHLGSVQAVVAVIAACHAAGMAQSAVATGLLLAAVALTGLAFTSGRVTVLDSLAIAASPSALALAVAAQHGALASVATVAIGAQLLLYGAARSDQRLSIAGAVTVGSGSLSLWWTTGAHDWAVRRLAPLGVREGDLITLAAGAVLLALGAIALRRTAARSYVALAPGIVLVGEALLLAQLRPEGDWAAVAALAVGLGWVALGAWRRLGALLVAGTALLAATILISSGERLAQLPGWVWMLLGGVALVALATAIERSADGEHGGVRDLVRRLR